MSSPNTTRTNADTPLTWAPTGTLTIDAVASHWSSLQAHLGAGRALEIDLAAIERIDTAGMQLLLQVRRVASDSGQAVRMQGLQMNPDTRRLLGVLEHAAFAAQVTPATATGQEG